MSDRPVVVYWNNQPTPYVVERFNAVADRGVVDLRVWFDNYREPDRSWNVEPDQWRFSACVLGTTDDDRALNRVPTKLLDETRPDLLITNYDRRHMALGMLAGWTEIRRHAVRCLPSWPAWETPNVVNTLGKHLLFRAIDAAKVPGPDGAAYAGSFGLDRNRCFPVTQSVNIELYGQARAVTPQRRTALREKMGLAGCVFVYVGRVWSGKGLDDLVTAFESVQAEGRDVCLLVVGEGPDELRLRAATRDNHAVHWHGFVQPTDLPEVYAAADVLVFPTLGDPNGLVVEEAMAAGLPVVTSNAAGDIRSRVLDRVTGRIVPAADPASLATAMSELAAEPEVRVRMGRAAIERASRATPTHYAQDFERFVAGVLSAPSRRTVWAALARPASHIVRHALRGRSDLIDTRMRHIPAASANERREGPA